VTKFSTNNSASKVYFTIRIVKLCKTVW